jgi:hypothetical protein
MYRNPFIAHALLQASIGSAQYCLNYLSNEISLEYNDHNRACESLVWITVERL